MEALADAIALEMLADGFPNLHQFVELTHIDIVDERTQGAQVWTQAVSDCDGEVSADPLPLLLSVCVTLRTALRGRSYRGRVYISGYAETQLQNGVWLDSAYNQALDIVRAVRDACTTANFEFGVRSGQLNGTIRPQAIVTPVISIEHRDPEVTTQRRRTVRG